MRKIISIIMAIISALSIDGSNVAVNNYYEEGTETAVAITADYKVPSSDGVDESVSNTEDENYTKEEVEEAVSFMQENECVVMSSDEVIDECDPNIKKNDRQELLDDVNDLISESDVLSHKEDIKVRIVKNKDLNDEDSYVVMDSPEDIVKYLESEEIIVDSIDCSPIEGDNMVSVGTSQKTRQTLSKWLGVYFANLTGVIHYNSSTDVISKVDNKSIYLDGVTVTSSISNVKTHYYLSPSKKYVKVTGDYTEVKSFVTPWGDVEITRTHAYLQYKWNKGKGMYEKKGGWGWADVQF